MSRTSAMNIGSFDSLRAFWRWGCRERSRIGPFGRVAGQSNSDGGTGPASGHVRRAVVDRCDNPEFAAFLRNLDGAYPTGVRIRLTLDRRAGHASRESRAYLATRPNRFEVVVAPSSGVWLKLIEDLLESLSVRTADNLSQRIERYIDRLNQAPAVPRWSAGTGTRHEPEHDWAITRGSRETRTLTN